MTITVNGTARQITSDAGNSLLDVLGEELRGTGSWQRCGCGRCGGCVILLDSKRVLACDIPISDADQRTIVTIEE